MRVPSDNRSPVGNSQMNAVSPSPVFPICGNLRNLRIKSGCGDRACPGVLWKAPMAHPTGNLRFMHPSSCRTAFKPPDMMQTRWPLEPHSSRRLPEAFSADGADERRCLRWSKHCLWHSSKSTDHIRVMHGLQPHRVGWRDGRSLADWDESG